MAFPMIKQTFKYTKKLLQGGKMHKKILLLCLGFFLVSMVAASSNLGTFKQATCIELFQTCDNCTYVNLTSVKYPDSTIEKFDVAMTKDGVDYNYTFCTTTKLGDYLYNVCGDKDTVFTCENIDFTITPSGNDGDNLGFYIIIIGLLYGIAFIGFFGKSEWVAIIGGMGMMFLGVYFVNSGIVIYRDVLTNALSYFTIALGAFFTLFSTISIIKENY